MTIQEAINENMIEKMQGHGLSTCCICKADKGWDRRWTCMCYKFNGKVYCREHIEEILDRYE